MNSEVKGIGGNRELAGSSGPDGGTEPALEVVQKGRYTVYPYETEQRNRIISIET